MRNIVLIPCWRRDDFLSLTLEYIRQSEDAEKYLYVFLLDYGHSRSVANIVSSFPLDKRIKSLKTRYYRGNSANLMEGYKEAMAMTEPEGSELVYLIEEDIFVGKDFFIFHENVHKKFDCHFVSGVRNQNDKPKSSGNVEKDLSLVYPHNSYQSCGISWKKSGLEFIIPHSNEMYYRHMSDYVKRNFPNSKMSPIHWPEQDGLIYRIVEKYNLIGLYPYVARAYHAGFVGYNRRGIPLVGDLNKRINQLKSMKKDDMNKRALTYKDIEPCDLGDRGVREFEMEMM